MEQRISFITLGVNDFDAMRQFYVEKFNWKPIKDDQSIVFFKLQGLVLALYRASELAADADQSPQGTGFKKFALSINLRSVDSVKEAFEELRGKGVKIQKPPQHVFWGGFSGYVCDPEDNLWEIAFNPFLELDQAGLVLSHQ
jgi:catechol 2,3-dioxygenase-like lactoylglutathione lyase family enzyme